jgi:hypothetical protein
MDKIIITKKIAKQGSNAIVVIPSYLKERLSPGKIVQLEFTCLDNLNENSKNKSNKDKEENDK